MRRGWQALALISLVFTIAVWLGAQVPAPPANAPVAYRVTFPEAEHHWMQVEATFSALSQQPLDVRMSRSSPGRYAVAEFAKNVFSVEAYDSRNQKLSYTRPEADIWRVAGHDGTVRVVYKIFGDHADGTYFGVDTTHAHLNMPAAFMWAVGRENQPIRISFAPPSGSGWKVATQLFATSDPNTFIAPNLQYFMDSPTELSNFVASTFSVPNATGDSANFRLVVHAGGAQSDVDELGKMVERLAREHMAVYGEFPTFDPGFYTFLLDYTAWGDGDAMEHRNSTSISDPGLSLQTPQGRREALDSISHEFFHAWNMERIRSVGLEPFDFTRENVSCCLWLGEGFTQYYGPLLLTRAGFGGDRGATAPVGFAVQVMNTPGRAARSPVQMSEYAPFIDGNGSFVDRTDTNRTFLSYYTYGAGIALALDLSLRDMSGGKLSLDDYMRLLWIQHGKPGGPAPGLVAKPYGLKDLRDHLATLTANRRFADDFFDKYVEGRELPDYARLLAVAGYSVRAAEPGRGWLGNVSMADTPGGLAVGLASGRGGGGRPSPVPFNTPLYDAGVDSGDIITLIDGQPATTAAWRAIAQKKPGDQVTLVIVRRGGATVTRTVIAKQDPNVQQVVPVETLPGGTLSAAQKAFRDQWLASRVK